jgi:alpha-mannosidase
VGPQKSLLDIEGGLWEIPTARFCDQQLFVRLFNPSASASRRTIRYDGAISKVEQVLLNGQLERELALSKPSAGGGVFQVELPPFGVGTLRITR